MSWLSEGLKNLGVRFDSHTLGNLVKNLAPVAGTVIGGPLGLAAAGGMGAVGELGRGGNLSDALKAGLSNAAIGGAGQLAGSTLFGYHGGLGGLGGIGGGASSAGGAALPSSIPLQTGMSGGLSPSSFGAASGAVGSGGGSALSSAIPLQTGMSGGLSSSPLGVTGSIGASAPSGGGTGLLSSIGSFAKNNPNAISGALQGLGGIATSGSKNALTNAQTTALQQQTDETAYDFKRRQARDALLAPLWGSLNTNQDPFGYGKVAKNPYAPTNPSAPAGA